MNQDFLRKLTPEDVEAINATVKGISCSYCHTAMVLSVHPCTLLHLDKELRPILSMPLPVVRFICPNCGRLELFDYGILTKRTHISC